MQLVAAKSDNETEEKKQMNDVFIIIFFFLSLHWIMAEVQSRCAVWQCAIVETSTSIYRRLKSIVFPYTCLCSSCRHSWKNEIRILFCRSTVAMWLRGSKRNNGLSVTISKTEAHWNSPIQLLHNTKPKRLLMSIKSTYAMDKWGLSHWVTSCAIDLLLLFLHFERSFFFWFFFGMLLNLKNIAFHTLQVNEKHEIPSQTNFKCVYLHLLFCHYRQPQLFKTMRNFIFNTIVIVGFTQQKQSSCHQYARTCDV